MHPIVGHRYTIVYDYRSPPFVPYIVQSYSIYTTKALPVGAFRANAALVYPDYEYAAL